jgi:3-methyl-2-oxobutanoate hydroxymethyltransferase
MKQSGERIAVLTAYDYSFAALLDRAGVDAVMVGDSLGMVVQGHQTTLPVTLNDVIYHCRWVARACSRALVIADMPFMSYQESPTEALRSAGRLMQEGGAHMVKLEGGAVFAETVRFLVDRGIPVCGHLGLTPQSVHKFGGFRVQGKDEETARQVQSDATSLADAGADLLVLEAMPATLAASVTEQIGIPTIGIGAGPSCDGQVLVLHDMLGVYARQSPKFAKNFMQGRDSVEAAVRAYVEAVRNGTFPGPEHSF